MAKLSKRKLVALTNLSPSVMSGEASFQGLQLNLNLDVDGLEDVRKGVLAACSS
jgi:hypothetical protein